MRRKVVGGAILALATAFTAAASAPPKTAAVASVDRHREELVDLAAKVWEYAETALNETRSAALLADYAEAHGFRVERGVAGMPTAFVASFGEGRPVIGILGEYDALPGISQKAQPEREPLVAGAAGHGCGHNLFGAASLGAALAVKEQIAAGNLEGTVRFYGTPAEEAVGGKVYMVREGLFDDVDAVVAWHPDFTIRADTRSSQAMVDLRIEFRGKAAHAAYDPWNGRSALDAVEVFLHALNLMREHVRPSVRMHYTIPDGGGAPNVVPETASVWCWLRDTTREGVDDLLERTRAMVQGAALATGTEGSLIVQSGSYEMLPSLAGARAMQRNLEWLGPLEFDEVATELGKAIQNGAGVEPVGMHGEVLPFEEEPPPPAGGSTDVADVSWVVPTIQVVVTTAPADVPWHAWPVVAASNTEIGFQGMTYAAKAMAATMVDLFQDPELLREMRTEHEKRTGGHRYRPFVGDGPPPVPGR